MKKMFAFSALLCASMNLSATEVVINDFKLWSTVNGDDAIRVIPVGETVVAGGCSDPDSYIVKASLSEAAKERIYTTLLSAKVSRTPITIKISGCELSRPAIDTTIL